MQPSRHSEPCPLRIKVAGLAKRRRGDQDVEGVQGGVESRMRARAHGNRVTGAEHQTADHERAGQQQQGAAWRIPVSGEGVLQPPPPARPSGTLPRALPLLGEQDAPGLLIVAQPAVVPGELLIRLSRVTGRMDRPVQPVQSLSGRQVGQVVVSQAV
jgi:hypothetical protein